jgi:hypothetical protein
MDPCPTAIEPLLVRHHDAVEAACLALLGETFSDDPRSLEARWRAVEARILDHIVLEETMLARFARANAEAAAMIRAQHERLLELVNRVGLEIQLHVLRAGTMRALVAALRAHAAYEERTFYPWAEQALDAPAREALCAQLAR